MPTVLVTGANRGIGLEFVRQYAADGWRVHACCRSASDALEDIQKTSGDAVTIHTLDVADHDAIDRLAADLDGTAIDLLINNAGRYGKIPLAEGGQEDQKFGASDYDDWAYTLRVNIFGPMKMSEAFVEHVAAGDQKKIVTITSFLGSSTLNMRKISGPFAGGMYAYRTSKSAVNVMMRSMAADLENRSVTVLALHPGWVRTDMGGPDGDIDADTSVTGMRKIIAATTIKDTGRIATYQGEDLPP